MRQTAACTILASALCLADGAPQESVAQCCPPPSAVRAGSGARRPTAQRSYAAPTGRRIYGAASRYLEATAASSQYEIAKPSTASASGSRIYGSASEQLAAMTTVSRRAQTGYSFGYNYSPYWYYYRPWYYAPYRYPYYYGSYRPWYGFYGYRPYGYFGSRPYHPYFGYRPFYGSAYPRYYGHIGAYYGPATYFYARPYTYLYYHYGGSYYW